MQLKIRGLFIFLLTFKLAYEGSKYSVQKDPKKSLTQKNIRKGYKKKGKKEAQLLFMGLYSTSDHYFRYGTPSPQFRID